MTKRRIDDEVTEPAVGDFVKVKLPGESLWAEVVFLHPDGSFDGRISNHHASDLHAFRFGDVLRFRRANVQGIKFWMPEQETAH